MLRHLINALLLIFPPSRFFNFRNWLLRVANVNTGENVCFCGRGWIFGRGKLRIGTGTWLSPSTIFYTHTDAPIEIGANCDIGPGVKFITGSHQIGSQLRRAGKGMAKKIVIEDGCWIGAYTLILGGVKIERGSVVAAGSVVTRDIKANVLVAGVPAMIKRELSE